MISGDYALGSTVYCKFTTRKFSTGAPFTLAGTPVVSAYEDDSTTEITAGITLTVDFDSRTGLNHLTIVASSGNGFESGKEYDLVITTGTVDSVSVVGETVGHFSIEKQSALRPTTAGRTVDVSATGEVDSNLVQIDGTVNASATFNLTKLNIVNSAGDAVVFDGSNNGLTILGADTAMQLSGGTDGGLLIDSTAGYGISINAGDGPGIEINGANNNSGLIISGHGTGAGIIAFKGAGASFDIVGTLEGPIDSITDPVTVGTNNDKSGYSIGTGGISSGSFAANAIDSAALDPSAGNEIADLILSRDLQGGSSTTDRNVRNALRPNRNRVVIATGGGVTVYEEDDVTPAWTGTATRDAAAEPITEILPA